MKSHMRVFYKFRSIRLSCLLYGFCFLLLTTPHVQAASETDAHRVDVVPIDHFTASEKYQYKDIDYPLTLINQQTLNYRGGPVVSACTAASLGMISEYWMNGDYSTAQVFAQLIIDSNDDQGLFSPFDGLLITDTVDELKTINYDLFVIKNSSKEALLNSLETIGPVAVLVKSGWIRNGANHMVIVSGYEKDNDVVKVFDPNLNQPIRLFWSSFDRIWKINFTGKESDPLRRTFFIIVPKATLSKTASR